MPTNVTVAVFVDRLAALRAGRNRWGWVPTELDLDPLTIPQRESLAKCIEKAGVLYLTQVERAPSVIGRTSDADMDAASYLVEMDTAPAFADEWEDAEPYSEATPETALAALVHLSSRAERNLAKARQRQAALEAKAQERAEAAIITARQAIAELENWLATPVADLVVENSTQSDARQRFSVLRAPQRPVLANPNDILSPIWGDTGEADFRRAWQATMRVIVSNGEYEEPREEPLFGFRTATHPKHSPPMELPAAPPLGEQGQALVDAAWTAQAEHIARQSADADQLCRERRHRYEHEQHIAEMAATEQRRQADEVRRQQMTAERNRADTARIREWAIAQSRGALVSFVDEGATTEQVIERFRAEVFDPIEAHTPKHRKISKTDLLLANPAFRHDERALDAVFDECDTTIGHGADHAAYMQIIQHQMDISMPTQYRVRLHRGRLQRKGETVGQPVEAVSILVTARLGSIAVSRAFSLRPIAPVADAK